MALVESLHRVSRPQVETRGEAVCVKEELDVFLEVEEVFVLSDVLALVEWQILWVIHGWPGLSAEEKPHVDEEDDQEFANGHDSKLERDANGFHADFFDLNELAVSEFTSN